MNNSGESGHPCLIPDLRGNAFHFSPLRIMFTVGLSYGTLRSLSSSLSCVWLLQPHGCGLLGSSVHRILQARILEWVVISSFRGSSQPRNQTQVSCIEGRFFTDWAMREAPCWGRFLLYPFSGCWILSKLFLKKYYIYMHTYA